MLIPICALTEAGCSVTVRFESPTMTLAPRPGPSDASPARPAIVASQEPRSSHRSGAADPDHGDRVMV